MILGAEGDPRVRVIACFPVEDFIAFFSPSSTSNIFGRHSIYIESLVHIQRDYMPSSCHKHNINFDLPMFTVVHVIFTARPVDACQVERECIDKLRGTGAGVKGKF